MTNLQSVPLLYRAILFADSQGAFPSDGEHVGDTTNIYRVEKKDAPIVNAASGRKHCYAELYFVGAKQMEQAPAVAGHCNLCEVMR